MSTLGAHRGLLGASAVVFAASAITTVLWCGSMASMPGMEMPGGWRMSMAWMRMPGQSWPGAAATFIGMWGVMMVAMMLPVLVPANAHALSSSTVADSGYKTVAPHYDWCGAATSSCGLCAECRRLSTRAALGGDGDAAYQSSRAPCPSPWVWSSLIAGLLQFTAWKRRQLACCRVSPVRVSPADAECRVAPRPTTRCPLCSLLCQPDRRPARHRRHGSARNGGRNSSDYR